MIAEQEFKPRRLRPLMIPCGVVQVPEPVSDFTRVEIRRRLKYENREQPLAVRGRLIVTERVIDGQKRPIAAVKDSAGRTLWIDIDPDDVGAYIRLFALRNKQICLLGRVYQKDRHWFIENPEPIPRRWIGRPRPVYEIHTQTREALVRRTAQEMTESYLLDAKVQNEYRRSVADESTFKSYLQASRKKLFQEVLKDLESCYVATGHSDMKSAFTVLDSALRGVHHPKSDEHFESSMDRIRRIAAVSVISERVKEGLRERQDRIRATEGMKPPRLTPWAVEDIERAVKYYSRHLPFGLTAEQAQAAAEILADMAEGAPMRRVLSGDVGSGKTGVYVVAAAAMIDAGHRVSVILPSTLLAKQVAEKLSKYIPEARLTTVTSDLQVDESANLWVGTVGIQHKAKTPFDFTIVDEQQRFSRSQREGAAADDAHLLEVTATCIPRTQALMDSNLIDVSRLRECHVDKTLSTRVWEPREKSRLFEEIAKDVKAGYIVMVIYPGKEISQKKNDRLYSIKEFQATWEQAFPGQISICHGGQTNQENDAAIESVSSRKTPILLATSIVEVGIDIERVRRVVVVQADRFGLSTLHQLRGRSAREGGAGYCDLVLTGEVKERVRDRLDYVASHSDGFKLAEYDLSIRGAGDATVDGHKQSGKLPPSPFKGYEPTHEMVGAVAAELTDVYENGIPSIQESSVA